VIVQLVSGEGGAWKTTCAINLAIALRQRLGTVRLLDFDHATGKVGWYLGQSVDAGVNELLQGKPVEPVFVYGVEVYPRGSPAAVVQGDFPALVRKLAAGSDMTIVDTRSGLDAVALAASSVVDVVFLLTRVDASIVGALGWANTLRESNKSFKLVLVEYPNFGMNPDPKKILQHEKITVKWLCKKLGVEKPLISLPWDPHAIIGNNLQHPCVVRYPSSPFSKAIDRLAELLLV
jgi:MinD-like ATPase involved in chromosome partitioning or flagellar assembly